MHGGIRLTTGHGSLDLLHEHPPTSEVREGQILAPVALRLDLHQCGLDPGRTQQSGDPPGLPERERRAARGQPQWGGSGHRVDGPATG